jgi:hypothetical protein
MAEPPPPTRARDFLTLGGLGLGMLGIVLLASGAYVLWNRHTLIEKWPVVDAQVISGTLYSRTPRSLGPIPSGKMWGAHFLVRFQMGDARFDSLTDVGYLSTSQTEMEHWLHVYPPGSHIQLRYDPNEPGRVVIAGGNLWQRYPGPLRVLLAGAACLFLAVVLIRIARRPANRSP